MRILKFFIFIFIFLNVPLIHALDFDCPNSHCGSNPSSIHYPFKLQDQQPQVCSHYINLTCNSQNNTVLNIPFSGDFHVVSVLYYAQSIILRDPENCLPKRLMNLNLSSSPFSAAYYRNYTFYNCPVDKLTYYRYDFKVIDCLSIFPNVTVASPDVSYAGKMVLYGCRKIGTTKIPRYDDESDIFSNLKLKWKVPSCRNCEDLYPRKKDESKNKMSRVIAILILIPLVMVVAFLAALYKRVADQRRHANARTTTGEAALPRQTTTTTTTAAVMPPQLVSVENMAVTDGQHSYLKTMIFSTFLEGNFGSLEGHDQDTCCTICLQEYSPQDIIRCLTSCHHYFHSQCIDQWFQDNSSCPVCRNSIFDV